MRIGVVSDTHSHDVPKEVLNDFKKADLIIHAGDFCCIKDLDIFAKVKEVKGVYGNMDDAEIRKTFPRRQIIECEGTLIGLCHGEGPPAGVLDVVRKEFGKDKVDIVVFGHSHHPCQKEVDGVLYFNPGSPNDIVFAPYCSYGIIEINAGKVKASIKKVKNR